MSTKAPNGTVDVDFSLAIHNRTGKYFIGRDLLETPGLPLGKTYYWWLPAKEPLTGLTGRIAGRLQMLQVKGKALGGGLGWLPARRSARPLLHLDPFTVPSALLRACDAVLCHDVGPVTHPELFDHDVGRIYRYIYEETARAGPHMIFVSRASQAAYEKLYPSAAPTSTRVIYPAIRADLISGVEEPVPGLDGPFLLTVGSMGDRKNQARCIAAFARSGLAEAGISYAICGSREPGFEAVERLAKATPGVVLLSYVSDRQLNWLYGAAKGFVLASLLEGFGMPVSEAIARGQVPLVSRDSVLHEVAGDGALQIDPLSEEDIAQGMKALAGLTDDERQNRLEASRRSLDRFSLSAFQDAWRAAFADIARSR
jgi:glycosyltransferase involved in cell wall biosynthesis